MTELLELLRAKSDGETLKGHTLRSLKRVEELKKFLENNDLCWKIKNFDEFFKSLSIAVFLHDLGKISYKYQNDFYNRKLPKALEEFLNKTKGLDIRHEILSALWSCVLLDKNDDWTKKIRSAILLHHYNEFYIGEKDLDEILSNYPEVKIYIEFIVDNYKEFKQILKKLAEEISSSLNDKMIKGAIEEMIKGAIKDEEISVFEKRVSELKEIVYVKVDVSAFSEFYEINNENPDYEFLTFLGSLRRCDYSASGDFEMEMSSVKLKEIFSRIDESIKEKKKEQGWSYEWQREILEKRNEDNLVLIAPTGSGKTEFSLLWSKKAPGKLVYTVPLRVALNDLYSRFKNYLGDYSENLGLLHSTAFVEYLKEKGENKEIDIDSKVNSASILAYPVILATPDQVFLTSLNYYGSDKVVSVYPYSKFVLDEVQSYTPEMAAIIIKTLKIIKELGGKILVMTATLPPYFRPFFENINISRLSEKNKKLLDKFRIEAKVCDTIEIKERVKNYRLKRHKLKVIEDYLTSYSDSPDTQRRLEVNEDKLFKVLIELKNAGKKSICIVVNNVSKAIAIYEKLKNGKDVANEFSIYLLHSRLLEKVKEDRIREIKEKVGSESIIVVATQIIEASVDLDFDAMITEISPIDSQIQRWGRVYRNRELDYSGEPNIYVFLGKTEDGKIKFDRGTLKVYAGKRVEGAALKVLEKTVEEIKRANDKLLDYEDERKLIEDVFNSNTGEKELWVLYLEEVLKNLEFLDYFSVEKKSQAQRLFREIAGFQVIIPAAMKYAVKNYGEKDWVEKLAELMEEKREYSWTELETKLNKKKWEIKEAFYNYSVNIPQYFLMRLKGELSEFKGHLVLWVSEKYLGDLWEYGFDKVSEQAEEDYSD